MNRMDRACQIIFCKVLQFDGRTITYHQRGRSVSVGCIINSRDGDDYDVQKMSLTREHVQFTVLSEGFQIDGVKVSPALGDRITCEDEVFELINGPNGRPWEFEDTGRVAILLHAQKIHEGTEE